MWEDKNMETSTSAKQIANYFINLASKVDENDLTNLKLQKLLYFAQGKYLAKKDRPLFKEPVEAWKLGPVVRDIYDNFKYCGSFPITAFDKGVKEVNLDDETKKFLDIIWKEYGKYSARYLVDLTHEKDTSWSQAYSPEKDSKISIELMKKCFKNNLN